MKQKLKNGFFAYELRRTDGSHLNLYGGHAKVGSKDAAPLLLVVSGSGCGSVFKRRKDGTLGTGLPGPFHKEAGKRFTVLTLEKRGVKLGERQARGGTNCSATYRRYAGLDARVADHLLAIAALERFHPKIIMVGHSEGTDVATAVAASSPDVDRLGFMSGGGPSQAFDFFIMVRQHLRGKDPAIVHAAVSGLLKQFKDVFRHPRSHERMLFGHPYSRWSSYFTRPSIDSLLKVSVPIFVAHGSADRAVPIESADFIAVEFMRRRRTNLTYRRYPGLDHSFYSCSRKEKGCDRVKGNRFPSVIRDFFRWAELPKELPSSSPRLSRD